MDLISREAVGNLEKSDTKGSDYDRGWNDALYSADILPLAFEGMTNGKVIKAVFESDNVQFCEIGNWIHIVFNGMDYSFCPVEFWDSPYKGVSE